MLNTLLNRWLSKTAGVGLLLSVLLTGFGGGISTTVYAAGPPIEDVQAVIKARLDSGKKTHVISCQGELICGVEMLPWAYRKRNYRPVWMDESLGLERAHAMARAVDHIGEDGLAASDYHLDAIRALLTEAREQSSSTEPNLATTELWADLDLLLTDAFLMIGSHLAGGRVNPETLHTDWKITPGVINLLAPLDRAAASGDIDTALGAFRPSHNGYAALRGELARLRSRYAVGGWPQLDERQTLGQGDRHHLVGELRRRLASDDEVEPVLPGSDPLVLDANLASAVRRFQQRNGLKADGVVGRETFEALNTPVQRRIRQVELNLERWRWLPHDLGNRYIIVNTADFNLRGVENGRTVQHMRVVVGRPARRSPVFSASMTYLVINPYWNVPRTIAVEDVLPKIQEDLSYLYRQGIHVFENWDLDAPELDPTTVDWQAYHANRFPFRLRQDPGPSNALGHLKFMFPNRFAVYLHDSPDRSLFNRIQRDFSSGCIRMEKPAELAHFVLLDDPQWTPEALSERIEKGETHTIWLKHPMPVHLVYMTAWVDETGALQFRHDIYDRDQELNRALERRRPA
ncbi:MAG: L,D-transpeptidase family protein [Desulfosarcina sp.]